MKSPQPKPIRLLQERHQENLEVMLKNLLKEEILSDITLHCRDGAVRAHKVILAASSPYFKKVFEDHPEHQMMAFVIHGIPVQQIKSLIELMYKGSTQISSDVTGKFCDIAEEFGIKGIVDEENKSCLNIACHQARDTRFKGQKRVTVDFEQHRPTEETGIKSAKIDPDKRSDCPSVENLVSNPWASSANPLDSLGLVPATVVKQEPQSPQLSVNAPLTAEARRRNNWAMKQRKYKCALCPASFKRASHLSRHQLVHTGERPYACDQCDKAFSRHDKLKHHIRKTHTIEYLGNMIEGPAENDIYTIGRVEMETSHSETIEEPARITREDLLARMIKPEPEPAEPEPVPKMTNSPEANRNSSEVVGSENENAADGISGTSEKKKGRGRPRKHPLISRPLIKRPRGRPRLNQLIGLKPAESQNYDITNMPFGDIEYLTKPIHMEQNTENMEEHSNSVDSTVMEPLVEIELDSNNANKKLKDDAAEEKEDMEKEKVIHHNSAGAFLQNIGLLENSSGTKVEIGQCTISVSNGPGFT